ncbi:uncharacterized protein LOC143290876 [Babylonia areolata]|uniref:uncharacterized protein LOC143290876 n=1 Tax=Babylonia areolata TaxID=304850 RepID=UPI003FD0DE5A
MGFVMPHVIILVAGGVVGLALIFQIVGLATPGWTTGEESLSVGNHENGGPNGIKGDTSLQAKYPGKSGNGIKNTYSGGLWKVCIGDSCFESSSSPSDDSGWLYACRAFGILGMLAMVASLICAVLICFMSDKAKMFTLVAAGAAAVGAACCMIEFAVYAGKDPTHSLPGLDVSLGYSFALTILAFLLALAAAALFFVGEMKGE